MFPMATVPARAWRESHAARAMLPLLLYLCHICESVPPEISILSPADRSIVGLPFTVSFRSSRPCSTALAIDGVRVELFQHTDETNLVVEAVLSGLSEEKHILSFDVLADSGEIPTSRSDQLLT